MKVFSVSASNARFRSPDCAQRDPGSSPGFAALNPGYTGVLVVLAMLLALVSFAPAQDQAPGYPTRMIRLLQGFPPGGNVEFVARLLAQEMGKTLAQTIVVEAKPGQAGGRPRSEVGTVSARRS